jgi:hypothetical protein
MEMPKRTPALADMAAALISAARMSILVFMVFSVRCCLHPSRRLSNHSVTYFEELYFALNQALAVKRLQAAKVAPDISGRRAKSAQ